MKRIIFWSIVSLLSWNYNQGVASSLKEASEAVGNELVRLGKLPSFSKEEQKVDEELIQQTHTERAKLKEDFEKGDLNYVDYASLDEIAAAKIPVKDMTKSTPGEADESALHSKIIVLANQVLKEYLQLPNENSLDVTVKNKKNERSFTVLNVTAERKAEEQAWGDYSSNQKVFYFKDLDSNRSLGKTSFSFEAAILGFLLQCQVESSWRLYGKSTNQRIFNNGRTARPSNISYSPQD